MSDALDHNVQPTGLRASGGVPRLSWRLVGILFLFVAGVLGILVYAVLDRATPPPAVPAVAGDAQPSAAVEPPPADFGARIPGYEPDLVEVPPDPEPVIPLPEQLVANLAPQEAPAVAERRQRIQQQRDDLYRDALVASTSIAAAASATGAAAPPTTTPSALFAAPPAPTAAVPDLAALGPDGLPPADPNLRARKDSFAETAHGPAPRRLFATPPSPTADHELRAGTIIPATLITGINTDLPGQLVAQVSRDVRDSLTGDRILVPVGSRLVGTYDSHVAFGQRRALVAWSTLQLPDGSTVLLGNMPGTDPAGLAGFSDRVNNHYFRTFSGATMLSVLGAGAQLSQPDRRVAYDASGRSLTPEEQLVAELGRQWAEVGRELVTRNLDVQPTLTIRPGFRFRVVVTQPIALDAWPRRPRGAESGLAG